MKDCTEKGKSITTWQSRPETAVSDGAVAVLLYDLPQGITEIIVLRLLPTVKKKRDSRKKKMGRMAPSPKVRGRK